MKKLISLILCISMILPLASHTALADTRDVYKSSENFSTASGDGSWDGGVWTANMLDTVTDIYTPLKTGGDSAWSEHSVSVSGSEIVPFSAGATSATANAHIGAAKTFTAPKDGFVRISYAPTVHHNGDTYGISVYQINKQMSFRVRHENIEGLKTVYPLDGGYINSNTGWNPAIYEMVEANAVTNIIEVKQGDKLHFEVRKATAGGDNWHGVYCDPVVEYVSVPGYVPSQRMVYQSSAKFSIETSDGTWDDGIWSAQILNPETDEYENLASTDLDREYIGKDSENAVAYVHSKDSGNNNNHAVGAFRIAPANNGVWSYEPTRFWYVAKTFTAPRDGRISVSCGDNRLECNDGRKPKVRIRKKTADGRTISLMDETSLVWAGLNKAHNAKHLNIKKGETIHFEVVRTDTSTKNTHSYVYWDPIVTYLDNDDGFYIPADDGRAVYSSAAKFSPDGHDGRWDGGIWSAQIVNPVTDEYINICDMSSGRFDGASAYTYLSRDNMSVGAYYIAPTDNSEASADTATKMWYTAKTFTAPKAGEVTLTCGEDKITVTGEAAPVIRIRKEGRDGKISTLLSETVLSDNSQNYAHSAITESILPGDKLHFEVVGGESGGSAEVYWNPVVSYGLSQSVNAVSYTDYPTPVPMYFNGVRSGLKNTPYIENGVWMVPFKECMAILGVSVSFDNSTGEYRGDIGGIEIRVKPDSDIEIFDMVDVLLENESSSKADDVMVQLDFISKIYGASVTENDDEIRINLSVQDAKADEIDTAYVDNCLDGLSGTSMLGTNGIYDLWADKNQIAITTKALSGDKFSKVLQLESKKKTNMVWGTQSGMRINSPIAGGDVVVISLWARTISSEYYNGKGSFDLVHQRTDGESGGLGGAHIEVGNEWERFVVVYKNRNSDIAAGGSSFGFQMGYGKQTIQIADFSMINYGTQIDETKLRPDSVGYISDNPDIYRTTGIDYHGREDNALWRDEALKRIEKHRVRDINVKVVDESGNPVENAKVRADMTRSEFNWGIQTNYNEMHNEDGEWIPGFYDRIKEHFNMLSEGAFFKYGGYDRDKAATTIKYAYDNNMRSRSHCYMWDALGFLKPEARPDEWITENSTEEEMVELYTKHASRILYNFGEHIDEIDVLNEPLCNNYFQTKYGREFVAEVFKRVELMSPDSLHYINEGWIDGLLSEWHHTYIFKDEILKEYKELGMDIDGIGFEGHYTAATYPQMAYEQIDYVMQDLDYASITEYDYNAGNLDEAERLDIEADFLRDMIILAYSHPKMVGFNIWTLYRWSNAVFYDIYWNELPAVQNWRELVEDEWNTHAEGVSDSGGEVKLRGHRGEYDITVEVEGLSEKTTLVVSDKGENLVTAVVSDGEIDFVSSEPVTKREITNSYPIIPLYDDAFSAELYKSVYATPQNTLTVSKTAVSGTPAVKLTSLCDVDRTGIVVYALYEDDKLIGAYTRPDITVSANGEKYVEFDEVNLCVSENSRITQRAYMLGDKLQPWLSMNYTDALKK